MAIMRPNYPLINLLMLIIGNEHMADQAAVGVVMPFNNFIRVWGGGPINRRWARFACPPGRTARPLRRLRRRDGHTLIHLFMCIIGPYAAAQRWMDTLINL